MAEIRKRRSADGTFRYDVRTRIGERQVSKTFRRRKDADAYATTLEADRLRGISVDPRQARRPVETVAKHWVASNPTKRPTTRVADDLALRLYILPQLGTRPVGEVVPADVQALVNDWSSHLAPRTVRRHYGVLRAVFAHAIANDWIGRSPCRNVKLPPVTTTRRRHLGTKEVTAIARAMPSDHRPIVWLGAVLGLRWSEIAGLRVGRLDLLAGTVTIAEAVTRGEGGRLVCGTPKSRAGRRTLRMPAALSEMLADHLASRGLTGAHSEEFVFSDNAGRPLSYTHWRRRIWLPACRAADCEGAGFHDLRRANATEMVVEGVDVKTAQTRLGHADVRTTLELYAQALEAADRQAAEILGTRFLGAQGAEIAASGFGVGDGWGMEAPARRRRPPRKRR